MSTKKIVAVQDGDRCRVLVNPEDSDYSHLTHIVNPDLQHVRGIPPEMWRISGGVLSASVRAPRPPQAYKNEDAVLREIDALSKKVLQLEEKVAVSKSEEETLRKDVKWADRRISSLLRACVITAIIALVAAILAVT